MAGTTSISLIRKRAGVDFGRCIDFNQTTSVVSYTTPLDLQGVTTDYSYFQYFNVRTIDSTSRRLLDQSNQGLLIIVTTNGIQVQARHSSVNGQIVVPISYISKREWHSIVVNWSNTMNYPQVCFDGMLFASSATNKAGSRLGAGTTTYIGNRSALDRQYDGLQDKHAMYNRLATASEIIVYHQSGILPNSSLVSYEMDETIGNLIDSSGNNVGGTPSNVSQNVAGFFTPTRTFATNRQSAINRILLS